jgi:hypothetical protein
VQQAADVEFGQAEDENGHDRPCVFASCGASDIQVGPIWGQSDASVTRALATLTKECNCGASFHYDADAEPFP